MSVHYKFKSNINYDTVTFDGLHISVSDLKKSIMQQKKIGKSSDFDLQITNAQTKEVYDNDETLVPKNTSVIVARVPVVSNNKKAWEKPELPLPIDDGDKSGHIRFDKMVKSADIANTNATEDDKVKAMITQSSQEYDPSKYVKSRSMTGPLPPLYTCFRCGKQGHWIKNCPTNNLDIKRSTGIPRSFMVPVDGPEHKGALLTSSGDYAVPIIDHHAYKEVKKEKPPFVFEPEAAPEPEAEIPEELLCMFCKSLLQEAVLIPCCGNSFCDECVRQALLDSDSHECPVCHEIDISPDTVIPNRFLRTAVMNFKNETGYTRVRKMFQPTPPPPPAPHLESPQPSPDSTVENQPVPDDNNSSDIKYEIPEPVKEESVVETIKKEVEDDKVEIKQEVTEEPIDDTTPPGTPLADEPVEDDTAETLPVQQDGLNDYDDDSQSERYHRSHRSRDDDYHYESQEDDSEPRQISTIETITTRQRFGGRSLPPLQTHHRPPYSVGMQHRDRQNDYEPQGRDFRGRYDRRNNNERQPMRGHRPQRYDMNQNDRYHRHENRRGYGEYPSESRHTRESHYDHPPPPLESRRPPLRYASPPPPPVQPAIAPTVSVPIPVPAQLDVTPQYHVPAAVPTSQPPVALLPTPQTSTFPPQPPPPGASPVDHSSHIPPQPPPPGVGPLPSIPLLPDPPSSFPGSSFKSEEVKPKQEEPSIDDRMEAFQRELDKRASESVRDRASRSSSRSRKRSRSSTRSSHSRSYSSSKSWSRTSSRSLSRSSRSRSRSSYSSRSRSRSYSRSRSRSRSKSRSYSRSRSRSLVVRQRSKSRSRSRDRDWEKRRGSPRDRQNINYSKKHSPSSSPPPRNYHPRNRNSPYSVRRPYNQPVPYSGTSYTAPYVAPTSLMPVPVLRTAQYVPSHLHPTHPIQPPPVTHPHPIEHYPMERTRYPYNELQYAGYNAYQHPTKTYGHQRYEREPRTQRYEPPEYQREYPRREEEGQRIQGWIGDRDREYKPRLRPARDQRKEVKELPKISEPDMKSEIRVRETREKQDFVSKKRDDTSSRRREETNERKKEESSGKQKEERQSAKHKKHHHHHRSKESRKTEKQESKIPVVITADATQDPAANLINVKVMPNAEIETKKIKQEHDKPPDKMKEKKHKHKKHKMEDQLTKKKKVPKKEKLETSENSEQNLKAKNKKKKSKVKALMKALEETRKKEKLKHSKKIKIEKEIEEPEIKVEQTNDPDVLTVMAEDLKLEPENPESGAELHHPEDVIKLNASTEDIELDLGVAEEPGVEHEKPELDSEEPENKPSESQTPSEVVASEAKEVVDDADPLEEEEEVEEGEADDEGAVQEEDELHVEVPELSKWEREEYEDEVISKPQRRSAVFVPRDKKGISTLSSDIIQRAENVIMQKPLKTAIIHAASSNGKEKVKSEKRPASKTASPVDSTSSRHSELKNITERSRSPNLQVTINTEKEKRSVQTKDETQQQPKRIKLDRSSFKSIELSKPTNTSHRTVIVEEPLIPVKKSDEKHQRKVESRSLASKHPKIHGPDYKGDNETKSSSSRSAKENIKIVSDRKHDNRRSHSREDKKREVSSRDRYSTRETIDFPRAQKEVRSVVTDFDQSKRYAQSSRSAAPLKDTRKRRSRSRSYDSTEYQQHSSSKRQYITTDTRRHEHYSSQDHNERHRRAKSPVDSSPTQNQKRSQSRKYSTVKVSSTRGERFSNTYDESKFEPDYDDDSDSRQAIREKNKPKRTSVIAGSSSHKQPKSSDVERHRKAEKRKTASSTSSPSSSSSASDSDDSSDEKTVKQKVDVEHKRHKKSKHKKHRKHKHKKRKSHKPKLKS